MQKYHISVLLDEAVSYLDVKPGKKYIDATLGGGGHTFEIIQKGGIVLGIDADEEAIAYVQERIKNQDVGLKKNLTLVRGNFREIGKIARENGFEEVDGVLFDLGVSSHQFDSGERGFSFIRDATLDMRMDTTLSVSAKDLVNGLNKSELADLFFKLGEEHKAKQIAAAIVSSRLKKPIETTGELANIVERAVGGVHEKIHPSTRVFQALRIAVNDELHSVEEALPQAYELVNRQGKIAVISFHSLEDRIVKKQFREWEEAERGRELTKKPLQAGEEEVSHNPRSRSAKLRIFEKL